MFSYTNRKLEVPSSSRNGDIVKKVPNRSNFKFSINLRCFQDKIEYQLQENFIFFRFQREQGAFFCQHFLIDLIEKWFPKSPEVTR